MSRILGVVTVLFFTGSLHPAWGAGWSVGANMGVGSIGSGETSGSSTVIALTSNALNYQPALRIGFADDARRHEVFLDSGVLVIDDAGSTYSLVVATAGYQHVFGASPTWGPLANVGVGFMREGGAIRTTSKPSYGGGVGLRRVVHGGHGAVRAEVRVDYLQGDAAFGRPDLTTLGGRAGFDLWF